MDAIDIMSGRRTSPSHKVRYLLLLHYDYYYLGVLPTLSRVPLARNGARRPDIFSEKEQNALSVVNPSAVAGFHSL